MAAKGFDISLQRRELDVLGSFDIRDTSLGNPELFCKVFLLESEALTQASQLVRRKDCRLLAFNVCAILQIGKQFLCSLCVGLGHLRLPLLLLLLRFPRADSLEVGLKECRRRSKARHLHIRSAPAV